MRTVSYVGRLEVCKPAFLPSILQNSTKYMTMTCFSWTEWREIVVVAPSQSWPGYYLKHTSHFKPHAHDTQCISTKDLILAGRFMPVAKVAFPTLAFPTLNMDRTWKPMQLEPAIMSQNDIKLYDSYRYARDTSRTREERHVKIQTYRSCLRHGHIGYAVRLNSTRRWIKRLVDT
jgi:hypothetical protein